MNGTVKTLTDRGYGFIAQADGTDLFFHRSQVAGGGFDRPRGPRPDGDRGPGSRPADSRRPSYQGEE